MNRTFGLSGDLSPWLVGLALVIAGAGLGLLFVELWRRKTDRALTVALTGVVAVALSAAALLRPVIIHSRGTSVGPKVVVLADRSRSLRLPGDDRGPREPTLRDAVLAIGRAHPDARLSTFGFGEGPPLPFDVGGKDQPTASRSDLAPAISAILGAEDELPRAIVVVSDGALDDGSTGASIAALTADKKVPVHTVSVAKREPRDATIRSVRTSGAAVAHQPMHLTVEVACTGDLPCESLPVTIRELLDGSPPALLASGVANLANGVATLDLTVTLDRAGPRLVEVAVDTEAGDEIPANNRRFLAFDVTRERVRVLHIAGRATYDVRALRTWLKSNASVDVVAFFILRSNDDNVNATDGELALIKFPVDELFTVHLPSFDAVVLQDFNAVAYRLYEHLPNLAKYVETGGGLVMVGGPDAFLGGGYQGTPLEGVLPVNLSEVDAGPKFTLADATPRVTEIGRAAPMLGPLRSLFGNELPSMPGANFVGDAKPNALVLWEHPTLKTRRGNAMPLLALGESGDGRAVSIALDGVHRLGFSEMAAKVAGRGHGALWDGLLGWLMRDPRFEPAQVDLAGACVAGEPVALKVTPLPGSVGTIAVDVVPADAQGRSSHVESPIPPNGATATIPIGTFGPGGYIAKVNVGGGSSTRRAFPCEAGGDEWADARPNPRRLAEIADATGGQSVDAASTGKLVFPPPTEVKAERHVSPVLPAWGWTLAAALALGAHWIARRRGGLA